MVMLNVHRNTHFFQCSACQSLKAEKHCMTVTMSVEMRFKERIYWLSISQDVPKLRGPDRKEQDHIFNKKGICLFLWGGETENYICFGQNITFSTRSSSAELLGRPQSGLLQHRIWPGSFHRLHPFACLFRPDLLPSMDNVQHHICVDFSARKLFRFYQTTWWHHPSGVENQDSAYGWWSITSLLHPSPNICPQWKLARAIFCALSSFI